MQLWTLLKIRPVSSQFFFNCKNRWLSLFIVLARGGTWNHRGKEETKAEWWGEMDRGEERDLLSSVVFDGSHDRLCNKRLMANDSKRKRGGKKWGGGWRRRWGLTSIQTLSAVQVSCSGGTETTRLSVIWSPRHTIPQTRITAWDLKKWFERSDSSPKKSKLTPFTSQRRTPCRFGQICVRFRSSDLSSLQCHQSEPLFQTQYRLHYLETQSNNWQSICKSIIKWMFLHERNLVTFLSFGTRHTFTDNLPASQ